MNRKSEIARGLYRVVSSSVSLAQSSSSNSDTRSGSSSPRWVKGMGCKSCFSARACAQIHYSSYFQVARRILAIQCARLPIPLQWHCNQHCLADDWHQRLIWRSRCWWSNHCHTAQNRRVAWRFCQPGCKGPTTCGPSVGFSCVAVIYNVVT